MAPECAFSYGNNKYYVTMQYRWFLVKRQGWLGRIFVGYARNMAEAMTLIREDARSGRIVAAA